MRKKDSLNIKVIFFYLYQLVLYILLINRKERDFKLTKYKIEEPILNILGIDIGNMFWYKNEMWVRVDRFVAKSSRYNACRFGYIGEPGMKDEWDIVLAEAIPINMGKLESLVRENIDKTERS